jgi:hypothetical protein
MLSKFKLVTNQERVTGKGYEMKNVDSIMTILHNERNHEKNQTKRDRDSKRSWNTEHTQ